MKGGDAMELKSLSNKAPDYFDDEAKDIYHKVYRYLKQTDTVRNCDISVVESFCISCEMIHKAYCEIKKHGIQSAIYHTVIKPQNGEIAAKDFCGFKRNPACLTLSDNMAKMKSLANELGLTPASRNALLEKINGNDDDDDIGLEDMLNGGGFE